MTNKRARTASGKMAATARTLLTLFAITALAAAAVEEPLNCGFGPLEQTLGGTDWQVYACSDDRSTVAISAPGNPAMPFYFFMTIKDSELSITGEGNGDKSTTKQALEDLENLSESAYWQLHRGAKAASPVKSAQ